MIDPTDRTAPEPDGFLIDDVNEPDHDDDCGCGGCEERRHPWRDWDDGIPATDPRKHPNYPRPGCTEPACGWPDPCDGCYDAACAEEDPCTGARGCRCGSCRFEEEPGGPVTDGHHEGDPAPVIGWGESVRRVLS